ncbi:hypothetical protein GGR54DRAFT_445552 [Hypoxylon sp. NC1633]|nr:hypothetical protein GGR54DRAFT_445552 [Hypoxylon sp. NC1633]
MDEYSMVPRMVGFFVISSLVCFFALVTVGLRICGRVITKAGVGWDDGFTVVSMVFGISLLIVEGLLCTRGIGYPFAKIVDNALYLTTLITVHNVLFLATILTNKLSILCFYLRAFSVSTMMRISIQIAMLFFLLWTFASIISLFAVCHPGIDGAGGESCPRAAVMENSSALSIFGDVAVLLLPLPVIWNLQMTVRVKAKITALFLLGVLVTVIAILRFVSIVREDFESIEFALTSQDSLAYAVLESNLGILCASLPMIQGLVGAWRSRFSVRVSGRGDSSAGIPRAEDSIGPNNDAPIQLGYLGVSYAASSQICTSTITESQHSLIP